MDLAELYQELIIDHGTEPRNHCCMTQPSCKAEGFNPLCGDKVTVYLKIENNIITQATFTGEGCAISMASASIMSEILAGQTIEQAKNIFANFKSLVTGEITDQSFDFGKLTALAGVKKFPSRVKCATLAWHTFIEALINLNN